MVSPRNTSLSLPEFCLTAPDTEGAAFSGLLQSDIFWKACDTLTRDIDEIVPKMRLILKRRTWPTHFLTDHRFNCFQTKLENYFQTELEKEFTQDDGYCNPAILQLAAKLMRHSDVIKVIRNAAQNNILWNSNHWKKCAIDILRVAGVSRELYNFLKENGLHY